MPERTTGDNGKEFLSDRSDDNEDFRSACRESLSRSASAPVAPTSSSSFSVPVAPTSSFPDASATSSDTSADGPAHQSFLEEVRLWMLRGLETSLDDRVLYTELWGWACVITSREGLYRHCLDIESEIVSTAGRSKVSSSLSGVSVSDIVSQQFRSEFRVSRMLVLVAQLGSNPVLDNVGILWRGRRAGGP